MLNMELKDRLKARLKELGIKQNELAARIGVSKGTVTFWMNGTNRIKGENLMAVARELQCSPDWLISGVDKEANAGERLQNIEPALQPSRAPQTYPLISWVAAGERAQSPDNFAPGAAEEWLSSTENAGTHGYWLIVKGPSMTSATPPSFPEGTPILVKPEGFDLVSGKFYIARHRSGETTFKQYIYDAGREYLVPLNAKFEPVEMDDTWDVIGRVIDMKAPRGVL